MNRDDEVRVYGVFARIDLERVHSVIDALEGHGVRVWNSIDELIPGVSWQNVIADAIERADGGLVFLSPKLLDSPASRWEIEKLAMLGKPVLPIVVESIAGIPADLHEIMGSAEVLDLSEPTSSAIAAVARAIRAILGTDRPETKQAAPSGEKVGDVAAELAKSARKERSGEDDDESAPTSVFVVHGHDQSFLQEVEAYIDELGIESVVLRRIGGQAQSLLQKFLQWGMETRFAVVLVSADDIGAARLQHDAEGVGSKALQFRARQNVILELGFFYGYLGWEKVFVLFKKADKVFPNFERPSDLDGVVFDEVDETENWKGYLRDRLKDAGFAIA